jgi:hypothetical protein
MRKEMDVAGVSSAGGRVSLCWGDAWFARDALGYWNWSATAGALTGWKGREHFSSFGDCARDLERAQRGSTHVPRVYRAGFASKGESEMQQTDTIPLLDPAPLQLDFRHGLRAGLGGAAADELLSLQSDLGRALLEKGLHFEGKPYPVSILPEVLSPDQHAVIASQAESLVKVLDLVGDLYCADPAVRAVFPACREVEQLISVMPDFRPATRVCRLDGVLSPAGNFMVMETNTDAPGGVIQNGLATAIWKRIVSSRSGYQMDGLDAQLFVGEPFAFVDELISSHRLRTSRAPQYAGVVNYRGRYRNEVDWMVLGLRERGVEAELLDAGDLQVRTDMVVDKAGRRIDLTYNKYELGDFLRNSELMPYLASGAMSDFTFLNPLVAQWVLSDKAALAVLTDERFAGSLTGSQRALVETCVPWTRLLENRKTRGPGGQLIDLVDYVEANRETLVLKPTNATRGEGVVVGRYASPSDWLCTVRNAARDRPYVAQSYLRPRRRSVVHPQLGLTEMMTGLDAYVFGGKFAGYQSRASLDPVMNVGRQGIILPVTVLPQGV